MISKLMQAYRAWKASAQKKRYIEYSRKERLDKVPLTEITNTMILNQKSIEKEVLLPLLNPDFPVEVFRHLIKICDKNYLEDVILTIPDNMWDESLASAIAMRCGVSLPSIPEKYRTDIIVNACISNCGYNISAVENPTLNQCALALCSGLKYVRYICNKPEGFWDKFKEIMIIERDWGARALIPSEEIDKDFLERVKGEVGATNHTYQTLYLRAIKKKEEVTE